MVALGLVAGVEAGVIVGGIGSRLVMRVLAAVNYDLIGVRTESGNLAGDITVDGTMSLIIFLGIFAGVFGGLVYIIARRWIPGPGVWIGLACGVLPFMLVGYDTIEKNNIDFELFSRPLLGIALFPMAERMDRYVPSLFFPSRRERYRLSLAGGPLRNGCCP